MQFSSFIRATAVVVSLAGVVVGASAAFADQQTTPPQQAMMPAGGSASFGAPLSNTGPYDSPDFVVPESQIFS